MHRGVHHSEYQQRVDEIDCDQPHVLDAVEQGDRQRWHVIQPVDEIGWLLCRWHVSTSVQRSCRQWCQLRNCGASAYLHRGRQRKLCGLRYAVELGTGIMESML